MPLSNSPRFEPPKTEKIPVEKLQPDRKGNVPQFQRSIYKLESTFSFERGRACETPSEILDSQDFKRLLQLYSKFFGRSEKVLKRRGLKMEQNLKEDGIELFIHLLKTVVNSKKDFSEFSLQDDLGLKDLADFKQFVSKIEGVIRFWLGLRSSGAFTNLDAKASQERDSLDAAIQELVQQISILCQANELTLDLPEDVSFAPMLSLAGGKRASLQRQHGKEVFRTKPGQDGVASAKKVNVESWRERREPGRAESRHKYGTDIPKDDIETLNEHAWIERTYSISGLPVKVIFSKDYQHLMPGAEVLFEEMNDVDQRLNKNVLANTPIVLRFGVDPNLCGGQKRIMYSDGKTLQMLVADLRDPEKIANDEENGMDMDYFGYLKKSMLTLKNTWMTMISCLTAKDYYLGEKEPEKLQELMKGFPEEFRPLLEHLWNEYTEDQQSFEQYLPQVKIPEIDYELGTPGFDPSRYQFMPVHGACYTVEFENKNGKRIQKTMVLPGDSGVGKSEILRELETMGVQIVQVIADDMLTLIYDRRTEQTFAIGDERGAFTKTDDIIGELNTTQEMPLVGYNAGLMKEVKDAKGQLICDEQGDALLAKGGNRRVIEPHVSDPSKPRQIDLFAGLINANAPQDSNNRVQEVSLDYLIRQWVTGPYRPSTSLDGGGAGSGKVEVPFWNEFIDKNMPNQLKFLVRTMLHSKGDYVPDPEVKKRVEEARVEVMNALLSSSQVAPEQLNEIKNRVKDYLPREKRDEFEELLRADETAKILKASRTGIAAIIANTHHDGPQETLSNTFHNVALQVLAKLKEDNFVGAGQVA